jgi:hypothetical protein
MIDLVHENYTAVTALTCLSWVTDGSTTTQERSAVRFDEGVTPHKDLDEVYRRCVEGYEGLMLHPSPICIPKRRHISRRAETSKLGDRNYSTLSPVCLVARGSPIAD